MSDLTLAADASSPALRLAARRIGAMVLRHFYLLRRSPVRLISLIYWPLVEMVSWGYIDKFVTAGHGTVAMVAGGLLAAVLLWEVMMRVQLGALFGLLEEVWARNLGHLFVSPLRPGEFLIAILVSGFVRMLMGVIPAFLGAMLLFNFSILSLGLPLVWFSINLILTGWWIGLLIDAMVLRYGQAAEELAWVAVYAIIPVACIYYPVGILPLWFQHVAWSLPLVYVYESLRTLMTTGEVRLDLLAECFVINLGYLATASALFLYAIHIARLQGRLLQTGE